MTPRMRRFFGVIVALLLALVAASAAGAWWARAQLRGSLAILDGQVRLAGLHAPVRVTRDALGIPTVRGGSRADVARATGFLHAQDRFFQMDLARRRAAGELAALVGARALPIDREIRRHRFRAVAARALPLMSTGDRALLDAYADGVNAGLRQMARPPFEYLLLRQTPAAWAPEDTLLVVLSMFVTLQDDDGSYEATLATMRELLPPAMFDFLAPAGSEWDAPVVGTPFATPPVPGPEVYDLRARRRGKPRTPIPESLLPDFTRVDAGLAPGGSERDAMAIGSNSFAVAGGLTADGRALVANDMHLTIRVPNTWYRASLEWPDPSAPDGVYRITGVTLPGVPAIVAGSNGRVAWGFTNSYADWSDIVLLETDRSRPGEYRTAEGWRRFDRFEEVLDAAGGDSERTSVDWTTWGPVMEPDFRGRPRAYRWVAHSPERLAVSIRPLETARTLEEAFDQANGVGAPGQNILVVDRSGRIGWSVYGSIPRRTGFDGRLPVPWATGSHGWDGWLDPAEYPRVLDPPNGRLWTANARVVDGDMLAKLGDGSYEIGSRARIIRDRLLARDRFDARDLLAIQLDTSSAFLDRWRRLLLSTLTAEAAGGVAARAALKDVVDGGWSGTAAAESAAYRLVRGFRDAVFRRVISFVLAECYEADPSFDYTAVRRREAPIWQLAITQPAHLLDPAYETWDGLLLEAADEVIEQATRGAPGELRDRHWSEYNVTAYRHPLSASLPFIGRWLDMPRSELPGDLYTPRVHWGAIGASERMVVSPGKEAEGILHMPTGQSGHPLSPFYANSHEAWVRGEPTPFLPGPAAHTLTLHP
ncbi:MAG: hypothetical protein A3H29_12790 [Acidobacteria bacterium RIFCSPLOWO2_02_FULL_67_21]|nr:MAG: hypothetical protein A3H29_12790 [Acidobacteria bacterium RIFCSPLOWO2_02_FULL_67_21]